MRLCIVMEGARVVRVETEDGQQIGGVTRLLIDNEVRSKPCAHLTISNPIVRQAD